MRQSLPSAYGYYAIAEEIISVTLLNQSLVGVEVDIRSFPSMHGGVVQWVSVDAKTVLRS